MNGIFYKNTQTNIPRWVNNLHEEQALGDSYITTNDYVKLLSKARLDEFQITFKNYD